MESNLDEIAAALAGGATRRSALRKLTTGLAGTFVACLAGRKAHAAPPYNDCRTYCKTLCEVSLPVPTLIGGNTINTSCFNRCMKACTACSSTDATSTCPGSPILGGFNLTWNCKDLKNDPKNCGHCNSECDAGETCCEGVCCPGICTNGKCCPNFSSGPAGICNDKCTEIWADGNNCGSCGHVCAKETYCVRGKCESCPGARACIVNGRFTGCCAEGSVCGPRGFCCPQKCVVKGGCSC
jgi:hypothetical protein